MDWSIIATFVTAGVGVWVAASAIVRERSPLRDLERITAVLKDTPADASRRPVLEAVRDDLSLLLNLRYRAPRFRYDRFVFWYCVLAVALLVVVFVLGVILGVEQLSPLQSIVGAVGCCLLLAVAISARAQAVRGRRRWMDRSMRQQDVSSTERPAL